MIDFNLQAFLMALLQGTLDTVFVFANGAVPTLVVAWLTDLVLRAVPFLRPFRENIKQFILARIEELRLRRAKEAVLSAGQKYKAELQSQSAGYGGNVPAEVLETLKAERLADAMGAAERIAGAAQARALVEGAIGALRAEGVNP